MTEVELTPAALTDAALVLAFMFAGDATLTLKSTQSGTRYTYRVNAKELSPIDKANGIQPVYFVKLMTGSDNENDYTYIGMIRPDRTGRMAFSTTAKSKMNMESKPCKGLAWALSILVTDRMPQGLEIWHEGRCARCHRKLTDPASIASGFGPECIKQSGGLSGLAAMGRAFIAPAVETKPAVVAKAVKPTPAEIIAKVAEDPMVKIQADQLWAKHPANVKPTSTPQQVLQPVEDKAAQALARSQGWTVEEAKNHLANRKIVNLAPRTDVSSAEKAVERTTTFGAVVSTTAGAYREAMMDVANAEGRPVQLHDDVEARQMAMDLKQNDPESYYMDGIMNDAEAEVFWYQRFLNNKTLV